MTVSVCMIAYNHERFVKQAIESILMQQTDFDFELIISDDYSTDQTNEVIKDCITNNPKSGKITFFSQPKNLGMQANFIFTLQQSNGKYIALCEGDDYWTDPLKLQKQMDYIANNDKCNLVFTDVKVWNDPEKKFVPNWASINLDKYTFKDIIQRNVISTCSTLFRKPYNINDLAKWLLNFKISDYPLYIYLLQSGYAYFIKDTTAVYRQHSMGVFSMSGPENFINTNIEVLETVQKLSLTNKNLFSVKKSLIKWYYVKVVRMSNGLKINELRSFIKQNLSFFDIRYNPKYYLLLLKMFLFPKSKKGVFTISSSNTTS